MEDAITKGEKLSLNPQQEKKVRKVLLWLHCRESVRLRRKCKEKGEEFWKAGGWEEKERGLEYNEDNNNEITKTKQVNEVLEMMQKADLTARQIPLMISRLQTLKPIHSEALSITQTIKQLRTQQEEIVNLLKSHHSLLTQVLSNQYHYSYMC